MRVSLTIFAILFAMALTPRCWAQEEHGEAREEALGEHHEEEQEHKNELSLILAGTYESEEAETFFTSGLEYARVLTPKFGISGAIEYLHDNGAWIVVAPFTYRATERLKLLAGPGMEVEARRTSAQENLLLVRLGLQYSFEIGERYSVTPALELDFVDEEDEWVEAVVFGVNLGIGF